MEVTFKIFTLCVVCVLLVIKCCVAFNLTILHTNDVHARIEEMNKYNGRCTSKNSVEGKCFGGMERLKTMIDEQRAKSPSLLLDAGDQFQGTLFFYVHGGNMTARFMNVLGYDAMALGNHEFDNGVEGLLPLVKGSKFDLLSSNVDTSETPELTGIKKSVIKTVGGEKIGIVGYTTKDTPIISKPGKVKFHDEIQSIQKEVVELKNQGVNKIIALGHAGFMKDQDIAKNVDGVDIVVGGHSNTFLYTGETPVKQTAVGLYPTVVLNKNGNNVLVVQDYAFGKYLGNLQVTFNDLGSVIAWNGNPIIMDKNVEKDTAVTNLINEYLPSVKAVTNKTVGRSLVLLDGRRESCRLKECNLGNMMADAMVRQNHRHADSVSWNHVAIAFTNSGGLRSSISQGEIRTADVLDVVPFRNTIDIIELSGKVIWEVFEHSVSKYNASAEDLDGAFLQVSGIKVTYDTRREVGKRVVELLVLCTKCAVPEYEPINATEIYKVITVNFMATGGDGYKMIPDNGQSKHTLGDLDSQVLIDFISANSPLATPIDGRIRFLSDVEKRLCTKNSADQTSKPKTSLPQRKKCSTRDGNKKFGV